MNKASCSAKRISLKRKIYNAIVHELKNTIEGPVVFFVHLQLRSHSE